MSSKQMTGCFWLLLHGWKQETHAFFISYTFISNARLKLAKNHAIAKQHSKAELLTFEITRILHPFYQSRIIWNFLKDKQKNKCVCIHVIIRLIIMKMKMKMKKDHIDTTWIDLFLDMDSNIVNIKSVLVWWCLYVLNNT